LRFKPIDAGSIPSRWSQGKKKEDAPEGKHPTENANEDDDGRSKGDGASVTETMERAEEIIACRICDRHEGVPADARGRESAARGADLAAASPKGKKRTKTLLGRCPAMGSMRRARPAESAPMGGMSWIEWIARV